jgi:hypothetical protein
MSPYRSPSPPDPCTRAHASRPSPRIPLLVLLVSVIGLALSVVGDVGCTPKQADTIAKIAAPAVRASCVVLRAVLDDGTVNELCATAADLVPLLEEMLRARSAGETPVAATSTPLIAVALDPPPIASTYHHAPRRRCVSWQAIGPPGVDAGGDSGR